MDHSLACGRLRCERIMSWTSDDKAHPNLFNEHQRIPLFCTLSHLLCALEYTLCETRGRSLTVAKPLSSRMHVWNLLRVVSYIVYKRL